MAVRSGGAAGARARSSFPCRVRHRLRNFLSRYPRLFLPAARRRYPLKKTRVVSAGAELVIEGFPRAANTFAVEAFELAQPGPVKVVHHLHAPAQIIAAVRMGIPTLALIRDPEEAIVSYLIRDPCATPRSAVIRYIRFYEAVARRRDRLVVADFPEVTTDFGSVIREINRKFGTAFAEFEHTEENVRRCFEVIEAGNRESHGSLVESTVSRPSEERSRSEVVAAIRAEYRAERLRTRRERAERIYRSLVPPGRR
jgi:hypothetical protein